MEKSVQPESRNIVITGPESTGKTELAVYLGNYLNVQCVPEFSRTFIEQLNRPYTYDDVISIARIQIEQRKEMLTQGFPLVIFDTGLLITKIWFDVVYHRCPDWLENAVKQQKVDLFLLCATDLPWVPDPVRENGGEMREKLFEMYRSELEANGFRYKIVNGMGKQRNLNALSFLSEYNLIDF